VTALLAGGCGEKQSTLEPASKASHDIAQLWWVMFAGSVVVFAVVLLLLTVAVVKRRGADVPRPRLRAGVWMPVVGGIAIPIVVLAALFALTIGTLPTTSPAARGEDLKVRVTGRQWFWDVYYPASRVRTANEIHIPVGVPVTIEATSGDVIHSFWVPELNRKIDMIPGRDNTLRIEARHAGVFRGQCAEFCGLQHAHMGFLVVAEPQQAFDTWLQQEAAPALVPRNDTTKAGQQVFLGSACVYCHAIAGTNASGRIGPDLSHLASRQTIGGALVPNTRGYLGGWILDPQHLKPGNRMPGTDLSGTELQSLLDYLESLK
jgi:cytochrome c oxidase subunit 2